MKGDRSRFEADIRRLETLFEALPKMEQKGARLLKSRAAAEATALYNQYNSFNAELTLLKIQAKDANTGDMGLIALMIPAREKAVEQAKKAFEDRLREGGFHSLDEAGAALLPPEEEAALGAEIDGYKKEYAVLLAKCEAALDRGQ